MSVLQLKQLYENKNFDSVNRIILNYVISYKREHCWPHVMHKNNISFAIGDLGDLNLCKKIENDKAMCIYCLFYGLCYGGHKELVEKYYKKFKEANGFNCCNSNNPFYYACRGNNTDIAKILYIHVIVFGSGNYDEHKKNNHKTYKHGVYYIFFHNNKELINYVLGSKTEKQLNCLKKKLILIYENYNSS